MRLELAKKFALGVLCTAMFGTALDSQEPVKREFLRISVPPLDTGAFRIPARNEITEVFIELYNSEYGLPDVASFKLEEKYIDQIYWYFDKGQVDTNPSYSFPEVASVKLCLDNGEIQRVSVYQISAKGPTNFSILGVRLRQDWTRWKRSGESGGFDPLVRKIYFKQTGISTFRVPDDVVKK